VDAQMDLARLAARAGLDLPVQGTAQVQAEVSGEITAPQVTGTISAPRLTVGPVAAAQAVLRGTWADGRLTLSEARAEVWEGRLQGSGALVPARLGETRATLRLRRTSPSRRSRRPWASRPACGDGSPAAPSSPAIPGARRACRAASTSRPRGSSSPAPRRGWARAPRRSPAPLRGGAWISPGRRRGGPAWSWTAREACRVRGRGRSTSSCGRPSRVWRRSGAPATSRARPSSSRSWRAPGSGSAPPVGWPSRRWGWPGPRSRAWRPGFAMPTRPCASPRRKRRWEGAGSRRRPPRAGRRAGRA
jgi:hypothetical protein